MPPTAIPETKKELPPIVTISSPVALDNLITNAESKLIKINGTAAVENDQKVTVSFSDGISEVEVMATVLDGKWTTQPCDLTQLQDGPITLTASAYDSTGQLSTAKTEGVALDKRIMPPKPSRPGTIWLVNEVITSADTSSLQSVTPNGQAIRTMYDRRSNGWVRLNPYLFNALYANGHVIEIQVNPEFTAEEALVQAEKYAKELGRLPRVLRRDAKTSWIHKGRNAFGGGNNNYLIHIEMAEDIYIHRGNLEETLVHEGAHTSLDSYFKDDPDWLYAQQADGTFISEYARDHPNREDIAETFLLYLSYRYRPESLTDEQQEFLVASMSHLTAHFAPPHLDLWPFH